MIRIMDGSSISILEKVRAYAEEAHGGQMRKYSNEHFIAHSVRVMETVRDYLETLPVLAAALLHDVLEDTQVTKRKLGNFLQTIMDKTNADKTVQLVDELTDVFVKSDYPGLNRRARKNKEFDRLSQTSPEAQTIKYADIIDNVNDITNEDPDFALVYIRENKQLLQQINKGNPLLYHRALQVVDDCLRNYWDKANVRSL